MKNLIYAIRFVAPIVLGKKNEERDLLLRCYSKQSGELVYKMSFGLNPTGPVADFNDLDIPCYLPLTAKFRKPDTGSIVVFGTKTPQELCDQVVGFLDESGVQILNTQIF